MQFAISQQIVLKIEEKMALSFSPKPYFHPAELHREMAYLELGYWMMESAACILATNSLCRLGRRILTGCLGRIVLLVSRPKPRCGRRQNGWPKRNHLRPNILFVSWRRATGPRGTVSFPNPRKERCFTQPPGCSTTGAPSASSVASEKVHWQAEW